ncbi:hypothetical protein ONZ45_g16902 [Pleurotus djamor]|nr:hypothetical protein ONZ45_g16902 [Pleurotus djamor]
MLSPVLVVLFCQSLCTLVLAQSGPSNWTTTPFNPSALPLAVRSPYLNVWLPQGNNPQASYGVENRIWDYTQVQSVQWYASAAVDGTEYRLFCPWATGEKLPSQTAAEFTATRTSFLLEVGGARFNMSFLSPIEPVDLKLQSLPFVYLYITVEPIDGNSHKVLLYSDIEPNIVAGDVQEVVTWSVDDSSDYVVLSTRLQRQRPFIESFTQAQDGEALYAFKKVPGLKTAYKIGEFNDVRGRIFSSGGDKPLDNTADTNFRIPASGDKTPVLGISLDLGTITTITQPAIWTLGFFRNTSILAKASGSSFEQRSAYFRSSVDDPVSAAKFVLDDFPRALTNADALDNKIKLAGDAISPEYASLLALSARQAMSAMEITLPIPGAGQSWNQSDVKAYMKNIGAGTETNGNPSSSVNDVSILYASFPFFLYLNPEIGRYLLTPLLEYQGSSEYTLPYAARHLGTVYPNAIADTSNHEHQFGVDESSSMIIMSLAYSLASGNVSLITNHYNLFRKWATYLENNAISPNNQASGDFNGQTPANHTNLALKGIIAIGAMAKMSEILGNSTDQQQFNSSAQAAITIWRSQSISSSGIAETYGNHSSTGLAYNLYADKLLRLGLVPRDVYDVCTTAYQAASSSFKYGLPISPSFAQNTSTSWMLFAASSATSPVTRDALISQVHAYASNNMNNAPFASLYDPSTGISANDEGSGSGRASTTTHFASTASPSSPGGNPNNGAANGKGKLSNGAIAGLVIAAVAVIVCFVVLVVVVCKRKRWTNHLKHNDADADSGDDAPLNRRANRLPAVNRDSHTNTNTNTNTRATSPRSPGGSLSLSFSSFFSGSGRNSRSRTVAYTHTEPYTLYSASEEGTMEGSPATRHSTSKGGGEMMQVTLGSVPEVGGGVRASVVDPNFVDTLRNEVATLRRQVADLSGAVDVRPPPYA